jgi:murein DD-endopeptidase MepM/ murein hydrolase activator NlpD
MQNIPQVNQNLPRNIEEYRGRNDPEAMKAVAKEMEAMFAYEMIKVMRETVGKSSKESLGGETYMSMFDLEISKLFAERGLGLQDMLLKGLKNIDEKNRHATMTQGTQNIKSEGKKDLLSEIKSLLPDTGSTAISSDYGLRHDPFTGDMKFHYGLDIPASEGTYIHPARKGTVIFSGEQPGYGNVVIIDHKDGFLTKYAHNLSNLVQQGQEVDKGSVIAQVGSTGKSTGSHMHFEVLYNGEHVDPRLLLAQR